MIDLRSDTLGQPDEGMKSAMMKVIVGHEGWNEDVNINNLEKSFSNMTGKEKSIFLPSMSTVNILVTLAVCNRTDEVIVEYYSHVFQHSASVLPLIAGVQPHPIVASNMSFLTLDDIQPHIRTNPQFPITKLIIEETPHTIYGGTIMPVSECKKIYNYAKNKSIFIHMDGARLFHASKATGVSIAEYAKYTDSLAICLTKGLGCPYGALLCGDESLISRVRYYKKVMGLSLHYVGYFAAAAKYALDNNIEKISKDIYNARLLAEKISKLKNILYINKPEINIIQFKASNINAKRIVEALRLEGIYSLVYYSDNVRFVLNSTVNDKDIEVIYQAIKKILESV